MTSSVEVVAECNAPTVSGARSLAERAGVPLLQTSVVGLICLCFANQYEDQIEIMQDIPAPSL